MVKCRSWFQNFSVVPFLLFLREYLPCPFSLAVIIELWLAKAAQFVSPFSCAFLEDGERSWPIVVGLDDGTC